MIAIAFEAQVERQIRQAQAAGEFDTLPGRGRPLPPEPPGEHDGTWWARAYVRREGLPTTVLLPAGLALKKQAAEVQDAVAPLRTESEVVAHVQELNRRIRAEIFLPAPGPPVILSEVDPDTVLARWQVQRAERRARQEAERAASPAPAPARRRRFRWVRGS